MPKYASGRARRFQQRNDVDAAGFEYRAFGQIKLMQFEAFQFFGDACLARQKGCTDPIGDFAKTQVKACRLDLILIELPARLTMHLSANSSAIWAIGKNAGLLSVHWSLTLVMVNSPASAVINHDH